MTAIDELQADLDAWIREFNESRPHHGEWRFGKTPMQTFIDVPPPTREKSGQLQAGEESMPEPKRNFADVMCGPRHMHRATVARDVGGLCAR